MVSEVEGLPARFFLFGSVIWKWEVRVGGVAFRVEFPFLGTGEGRLSVLSCRGKPLTAENAEKPAEYAEETCNGHEWEQELHQDPYSSSSSSSLMRSDFRNFKS